MDLGRTVPVLAALVLGASGCAGGSDGDADSDALRPQSLVLEARDVPGGFSLAPGQSGPVTNGEVAASREPGYEGRLREWGRRGGYTAFFARRLRVTGPLARAASVESRASVYGDEDGAAESFAAGLAEFERYVRIRQLPRIGDETHAFRTTAESNGRPVEFLVVTWRTDRVLSTVVVAGQPGRVRLPAVIPLARRQQARVERALAGA